MPSKLTGRRRTIGSRGIGRSGRRDNGDDGSTNLNKSTRLDKYATKQRISPVAKQALLLTAAVIVIGATAFHFQKSLPFSLVNKRATVGNCELRTYPKRRYYGLNDRPLPDFLNTEYIYGELPRMLQPYGKAHTNTKLCVDQSEWYNPNETNGGDDKNKDKNKNTNQNSEIPALPFADGTNPSILKLVDNPRIDPSIRDFFEASGGSTPATTPYYLATICMTDSQCSWDLTPEEIAEFHLSPNDKPSTVRTVLLVLNRNFETLEEATIHARIDAFYGGRRNRRPPKPQNQLKTFALDDARLFTHKGQIWVSYREGKLFGYEKQVLNQLHFDRVNDTEKTSDANGADGAEHSTKTLRATNAATSGTGNQQQQQLTVTFLASEVETLCCGRNMALIDNVHTNQLQALTWVDPVTVVDVDVHKTDEQLDGAAAAAAAESSAHRRRLSEANDGKNKNKKKSHMHGTNGFMVHLPSDGEYLGIGHFHRPNDRNKNEYARFGHHYTHAFFTISDKPPFRLKRLSPELVLPSHVHPEDAEVIQFWSGLELSSSKTLALVYGINDCEGAAIDLDLAVVENLLRDVPEGKEVVDFMMMPLHHR
mmetsp:Transcript_14258/g.33145  ORF Transcript_14258/g.33145 Transcript_14258/m.33145 type:complete len:594 (-) Transcript_14258:98-1879(-)